MKIGELQGIAGIQGEIFAAEPMSHHAGNSFIGAYGVGYGDTFRIDEHEDAWIANGCDDSIPYLHRLIYKRSTIHNSAVNLKGNLIAGGGFEFEPLESYFERDENGVYDLIERSYSDSEKEQIIRQAQVFSKNVGAEYFRKKAAVQLALYGGYYKLSGYGLNPQGDKTLMQLFAEDYVNVRMSSKREWMDGDFNSLNYYFSRDWGSAMPYKAIPYEDFRDNPKRSLYNAVGKMPGEGFGGNAGFEAKFCGRVTPYRNYYATPDYEALDALTYMDIDYMISQKDFKDLSSGFSLDHIIVRYRTPQGTDAEEKRLRAQEKDFVKKNFKGYDGERSMITWASPSKTENGTVQTPKIWDVIEIPHNNNPERFNTLREERTTKILNAHSIVSGDLIGLPGLNKSGFSSQSEFLIAAQKNLFFSVIRPLQSILEEDMQNVMINAGIPVKVRVKKSAVNFRNLTEQMLKWAYGKDEIRGKFGDDKMTDEVAEELMRTNQEITSSEQNGK